MRDDALRSKEVIEKHRGLFEILEMVPEDLDQQLMDLAEEQFETHGASALYDREARELYVADDLGELNFADEIGIAYEYMNALVHQHFEAVAQADTVDASVARTLLLLAAAEYSYTQYLRSYATVQNITEVPGLLDQGLLESTAFLARAVRVLDVVGPATGGGGGPGTSGRAHVFLILEPLFESGGWAAVDAFYTTPVSTEQLWDKEQYFDGVAPVDVELPDLAAALGSGWSRGVTTVMGLRMMQAFVWGTRVSAVGGWVGDRFTLFEGPQGERALATLILFDGPNLAGDLREVATRFAEGRDEVYVGVNGNQALLLIGPSAAITAKMKAQFPDF